MPFGPLPRIRLSRAARPRVDFLVLHRGRALVIDIHGRSVNSRSVLPWAARLTREYALWVDAGEPVAVFSEASW